MKVLLLSGGAKIASKPILEVIRELDEHDVEVHLAMWAPPTESLRDGAHGATVWGPRKVLPDVPVTETFEGSTDGADFASSTESEVDPQERQQPGEQLLARLAPRGFGPERLRAACAWRALRVRKRLRPYKRTATRVAQRVRRFGQPGRTWRHLRRDAAVMGLAREADVIVAMDAQSVLAAWKLARLLPAPAIVYGLSAGRGIILRRLAG